MKSCLVILEHKRAIYVPVIVFSQLLRMFFRQQDELRRLKEELTSKDVRIRQLELELNNLKNVSPNNV